MLWVAFLSTKPKTPPWLRSWWCFDFGKRQLEHRRWFARGVSRHFAVRKEQQFPPFNTFAYILLIGTMTSVVVVFWFWKKVTWERPLSYKQNQNCKNLKKYRLKFVVYGINLSDILRQINQFTQFDSL